MDVYVARQPIFDQKQNIFGYELLYRKSMNNYYEGSNDNQATAELITNSFLAIHIDELTEGKRAFLNFSEELLFNEIPLLLPKEMIVVEILERVKSSDKLLQVCKKLRENGYMLALDDFVFDESFEQIINEVHIIKIEYPFVSKEMQLYLLEKYHGKVKFLAEKVETREDYESALSMGYDYFQGYFFSKPVILKGNDLPIVNANLARIIQELQKEQPDYQEITTIIESDLGLSYKLFRMANSVLFGSSNQINSVKSALVRLGIEELRKWTYLMILKENQRIENMEMIKNLLIRAKMMEFLSKENGEDRRSHECFVLGLFSDIHILLYRSIDSVVEELAFNDEVKEALLGKENQLRTYLDFIICYEKADWNQFTSIQDYIKVDTERFMEKYIEAVQWASILQYE